MKPNNETCIQRARFLFYFFEKGEWKNNKKPPLEEFSNLEDIKPEQIRSLKDCIAYRLDRIAGMVEILQKAHGDWVMTPKKDCLWMETESFDFNPALEILKKEGFKDNEFVLEVEYKRKWGFL